MDASSIPPPPTFTAPPTAVPASAPAPSANLTSANYPPYAESDDTTALAALNERNGSSKKTIAKFIEQAYPRLPSNHPALLTQHLNLLKSNGLLVMVKKSYKLPKFDASPPTAQRKRGRPPKRKPNADPQPQPQSLVRQNASPQVTRRGPGRPPKARRNIVDQPGPPARWGRPPGLKRPGCPSKPKSELAFSNGTNWRPDRPPKNQTNTTAIPLAPPGPALLAKTVTSSTVPSVPPDSSLPSIPSRGRGRPKKNAAAVPPSGAILQAVGAGHGGAGVARPRAPVRRSVGPPKKGTYVEEELRSKLEYFQLKVNESLGVIKPHFSIASPLSAIAAVQELERLGTMDLNAPLRKETQELPPWQLAVRQPQHFCQQLLQMPSQHPFETQ